MVLDECPKLTNDKKIISKTIDISTNWAKRSKVEFADEKNKEIYRIIKNLLDQNILVTPVTLKNYLKDTYI